MTNQEAAKVLSQHSKHWKRLLTENICSKEEGLQTIEALDMAIKALEQEPCDKYIKEIDHLRKYISKLETQIVEQEPKIGHWIEKDGFDGDTYYDCSECGESFCLIDGTPTDNLYNFCPNCGARMVEPQEREDNE